MKTTRILLAAIIAATSAIQAATAEHKLPAPLLEFKTPEQLAVWRQEMTAKAKAADALAAKQANSGSAIETAQFYTGKPFLAEANSYAFKFRNYEPELNRWTTADPSGFPDGVHNSAFVSNHPVSFIDDTGLTGKSVLLVTVQNLYGNGENFAASSYLSASSYVDFFVNSYNSTKADMRGWDSAHQRAEGWFLRDGDIFDKRVVSSNSELLNVGGISSF